MKCLGMKAALIMNLFFLIPNFGASQNFDQARVLRPFLQKGDTTAVKVRYDQSGQIVFLSQKYQEVHGDTTYVITESYRKDFWSINRFRNITEVLGNDSIVHRSIDGKQYQFNRNGQITHVDNYVNGDQMEGSFELEYYPNGALKFRYEVVTKNYVDYRFPNGDKYDFGNFKNGQGKIVHLNSQGIPCIENITVGNKSEVKILCEDYK